MIPPLRPCRRVASLLGFLARLLGAGALGIAGAQQAASSATLYSHGNPTAEEQYLLELINRARANPTLEGINLTNSGDSATQSGISYFSVNVAKVRSDFASYPARPPLAFKSELIAAARAHSQDMANNRFQGHDSSNGTSFAQRVQSYYGGGAGSLAENVYAYSKNAFYGHAGLNIDWGSGPDGVQSSLGHRKNIMNSSGPVFTEVGIGVTYETTDATSVGPQLITQDFARANTRYLLGVVYHDMNGNGFYDAGEGLSGVTVSPSAGTYYAVTSTSGGYAFPVTGMSGSLQVAFSGGALTKSESATVSLTGENVKLDYLLGVGASSTARLINLSTRAQVEAAPADLVPGFVISGTGKKKLLIRAVGPTLKSDFQITDALADPKITLYNSASQPITSNNDWGSGGNVSQITQLGASVGAYALPSGSKDAALLVDLDPGLYTASVSSAVTGQSGIALVELFDLDVTSASRLVNISARAFVGTGSKVVVPGLVISGQGGRTLMIRGVGPTLGAAPFHIPGTLANPKITLFNSSGHIIGSSDNWGEAGNGTLIAQTAAKVGAFALPAGSKDAVLLTTLPAGLYTVEIAGVGGATGVALVEIYEVN